MHLSKEMLSLVIGLLFLGQVQAFWRLPCLGRAGVARMDPVVDNGTVSDHVHVIHGSGDFSMTSDADDLLKSNCTSCAVTQDKSAYWTPALYFQSSDGNTTLVNQVGGMLAYYLFGEGYGANPQAFPNGFTMIAGNKTLRNFTGPVPDPPKSDWTADEKTQFALSQKALGFNCLDYSKTPEPSLYRHFMPDKSFLDANCTDGLRLELMFPSCWNGKDLDSPDHKSHMAYPDLVNTGTCPPGFETQLVSLFYETIWDTYAFKGQSGNFVLSTGDTTGYGYHGDFIAAWQENFLQQAVDTCQNPSGEVEDCPIFTLQDQSTQEVCKFQVPDVLTTEDVLGPRSGLPGSGTSSTATAAPLSTMAFSNAPVIKAAVSTESAVPPMMPPTTTSTLSTLTSLSSSSSLSTFSTLSLAPLPSSTPLSSLPLSSSTLSTAPISSPPPSTTSYPPIVSTMYSTSGDQVCEILVEVETVTVTVPVTATLTTSMALAKRGAGHLHRHAHAHGRARRH